MTRRIRTLAPFGLAAIVAASCALPELQKISDSDASRAGAQGGGGRGGAAGFGGMSGASGGGGDAASVGTAGSGANDGSVGGGGTAAAGGSAGTAGSSGASIGGIGGAGTSGSGGAGTGGSGGAGTGGSGGAGTGGTSGSAGRGGSAGSGGTAGQTCTPAPESIRTQCNDCIDNDADSFMDARDDDCTGAIDNDEGSFKYGIPGDNLDPCVKDCFYDGNSGAGDDGCRWNLKCDSAAPGGPNCIYDVSLVGTSGCPNMQSQACLNFCGPKVPNGCDCFGCCQIPGSGAPAVLIAAPNCSSSNASTPAACPPCLIRSDCFNPCDQCELCIGKRSVPAACGGVQVCPAGQARCGLPNQPACPSGSFCLTGCCTP